MYAWTRMLRNATICGQGTWGWRVLRSSETRAARLAYDGELLNDGAAQQFRFLKCLKISACAGGPHLHPRLPVEITFLSPTDHPSPADSSLHQRRSFHALLP